MQLKAEEVLPRLFADESLHVVAGVQLRTYYNIDRELACGPNDNHRRHVFNLSGLWELPFGKAATCDAGGVLDALVGGWQDLGLHLAERRRSPSYRDCNADRDTGWCRPDLVGEWKPDKPAMPGS